MERREFVRSLLVSLGAAGGLLGIIGCPSSKPPAAVNEPNPENEPVGDPNAPINKPAAEPEASGGEATAPAAEGEIPSICTACGHEEVRELAEVPGKCSDCEEMAVYPATACPQCGAMNAIVEPGAEITCRKCKHKWTPEATE